MDMMRKSSNLFFVIMACKIKEECMQTAQSSWAMCTEYGVLLAYYIVKQSIINIRRPYCVLLQESRIVF